MIYKVYAKAVDRRTGENIGKPRYEIIDTETNEIFREATNSIAIKNIYERFWNDLNINSKEKIIVLEVI